MLWTSKVKYTNTNRSTQANNSRKQEQVLSFLYNALTLIVSKLYYKFHLNIQYAICIKPCIRFHCPLYVWSYALHKWNIQEIKQVKGDSVAQDQSEHQLSLICDTVPSVVNSM